MNKPEMEMHIRLSREQTRRLLEWSGRRVEAEVNASIEPSGYRLEIEIDACLPNTIQAKSGSSEIDLGDVDLTLVEVE